MARKKTVETPAAESVNPVSTEQTVAATPVTRPTTVYVALNRPLGIKYRMPDSRFVELKGNGSGLVGKDMGILQSGTFGITAVAADDWEYIRQTYGEQKIFKNGLCFATNSESDTSSEAVNRSDTRNGWEPIDTTATRTTAAK